MYHVVILVVWYAVLFGWTANRKKRNVPAEREHKEEWIFANVLGFYLYAVIHAQLGYVYIAVASIILGALFNYALIEYYWNRHQKVVNIISQSLTFKIVSIVLGSVIVSGSVLYSGLVIEELTYAPSSAMTNYVAVFSLIILAIFLPLALVLIIEIFAPIVVLSSGLINKKAIENKAILVVTVLLFIIPLLTIGTYSQFKMLNTKFFNSVLYDTYHENSETRCTNIPSHHKFVPISATEVSAVYYDQENDTYNFYLDKCKK